MPLTLKAVPARRGALWVRDGIQLFFRAPLGFSSLMAIYSLAFIFFGKVLPWPLGSVVLGSFPLMVLGFMLASQSVLLGGKVSPRQFIEPLFSDTGRRRALLLLCGLCLLAMVGVSLATHALTGDAVQRFVQAAGHPDDTEALSKAAADPGLTQAFALSTLGLLVVAVPFWHAPALVLWGGQGALQALFSSTLAVWRNRGAMFVYGFLWTAVQMGASLALVVLALLLGSPALVAVMVLPLTIVLSAALCVSLLFTFNDSFGTVAGAAPGIEANDPSGAPGSDAG